LNCSIFDRKVIWLFEKAIGKLESNLPTGELSCLFARLLEEEERCLFKLLKNLLEVKFIKTGRKFFADLFFEIDNKKIVVEIKKIKDIPSGNSHKVCHLVGDKNICKSFNKSEKELKKIKELLGKQLSLAELFILKASKDLKAFCHINNDPYAQVYEYKEEANCDLAYVFAYESKFLNRKLRINWKLEKIEIEKADRRNDLSKELDCEVIKISLKRIPIKKEICYGVLYPFVYSRQVE